MKVSPDNLRTKTFAYLKPALPSSEPAVVVERYHQPVLRNLGNGLLVSYLIDQGSIFRVALHSDLADVGMNESELHEHGLRNLAALANTKLRIERADDVFVASLDRNFEASLLLLDSLWDNKLASITNAGVVATVPARHVLAFSPPTSPQGVDQLRYIAAEVTKLRDHLLTPFLYRRVSREWVPLM